MIIEFTYNPNPTGVLAFFDATDKNIYVNSCLGFDAREIVIAHEEQHKRCFESKCKCWTDNVFLCEYHAMKACFEYVCTRSELRFLYLRMTRNDLERYYKLWKKGIGDMREHYLALRKLCKTKAFWEFAERVNTSQSRRIRDTIRRQK